MDPTQDPTQNLNTPPTTSADLGIDSSDNMTPEEMVANLTKLKNLVDAKMRTFHGQKKNADSQLVAIQNNAIQALFDVLQKSGVNPADQASVNAFLQKLQQVNPEGYQIFENAINNLLSQKNDLNKMQPPQGFAEPLNAMGQLGQEPQSPADINLHLPMNKVNQIPEGPIGPNAQPLPLPPTSSTPLAYSPPSN